MGISLWEIVHIFHVVRFYFCLPIRMVRLSYKRTTLYGSHDRFSRPLSLSLFLSLCIYELTRFLSQAFHEKGNHRGKRIGERRGGKKGRPKGRGEREEEGTRCGGSRVGNGRDGEQCRVIEHKSHNTASGWHINYHRGPGRNFSQNSAKYSYLRRLYPLPSLSLFLSLSVV